MRSLCHDRKLFHEQGFLPAFLSENDTDAEKLFKQQKVSIIMTTYYGLGMMKNVPFQYEISPLPFTQTPKTLLLATGLPSIVIPSIRKRHNCLFKF
jgi:multiple sugar transport system substrate-binding protein